MTGSAAIGSAAISVSRGEMNSMKPSANAPPAIVFMRYMIAGPAAMRTALRSFVRRAMRSPVRMRAKYDGSSDSSARKRSLREIVLHPAADAVE